MLRRYLLQPDALGALGVFGLALGVYVSSLPPSITWSNAAADSGELATVVRTLGVPHPPGYPTYVLIGKLFTFLPVGDVAYRLNLMSAFFGAAGVSLTFLAARQLLRIVTRGTGSALASFVAALLAAVTLAFAPIYWGQSSVAEVYALNAFFVAAVVLLLVLWLGDLGRVGGAAGWRKPVLASFLFGLGMGNHFTLALAVVPLGAVVLWRLRGKATIPWRWMTLSLATGLLIYLYLPVSAAGNPPINWGDASNWSGFYWEVSATPYRGFVFGVEGRLVDNRILDWPRQMLDQFQGVGVVLGLVGLWRLWRRDRLLTAGMAVSFLAPSVYATFYATGDSFVFLIPAVIVGSLWIGVGVAYVVGALAPTLLGGAVSGARGAIALALIVIGLAALMPGLSIVQNHGELDLSRDTEARDFGPRVYETVESDAIVIAQTDRPLFALWYHSLVVDKDADVVVVARNFLASDWYLDSFEKQHPGLLPRERTGDIFEGLQSLVERHLGQRPLYLTEEDDFLADRYELREVGPVFRIERPA